MLTIEVREGEMFNDLTNEFVTVKSSILQLEHSLLSVSKWESKWKKPFLSKERKTPEEMIDYVRCMTINKNVDQNVYYFLTDSDMSRVVDYIEDDMTATRFYSAKKEKPSKEIITAEIIYYWMIAANIPWECEKWHLNRLLTLIRVCGIKNNPGKKMSRKEIFERNRALNKARREATGSNG